MSITFSQNIEYSRETACRVPGPADKIYDAEKPDVKATWQSTFDRIEKVVQRTLYDVCDGLCMM